MRLSVYKWGWFGNARTVAFWGWTDLFSRATIRTTKSKFIHKDDLSKFIHKDDLSKFIHHEKSYKVVKDDLS